MGHRFEDMLEGLKGDKEIFIFLEADSGLEFNTGRVIEAETLVTVK